METVNFDVEFGSPEYWNEFINFLRLYYVSGASTDEAYQHRLINFDHALQVDSQKYKDYPVSLFLGFDRPHSNMSYLFPGMDNLREQFLTAVLKPDIREVMLNNIINRPKLP